MAVDYGTLLNIAALWAAQKYGGGGSGDTPNTYNIPLTPEQKRAEDEKWNAYKSGGSPIQKAVQSGAAQFFAQQPTTAPGFRFMSDELKGQPFAGGITLPGIDFSTLLGNLTNQTPKGSTPPPLSKDPRGNLDLTKREVGDPRIPDVPGRDIGGMVDAPPPGITDTDIGALKATWDTFRAQHPNWAKLGVETAKAALSALGGAAGAAAGWYLKRWLMSDPESPLRGINGGIGGAGDTRPGDSEDGFLTGSIAGLHPDDRGAPQPPKKSPGDAFFPITPIEDLLKEPPKPKFADIVGGEIRGRWNDDLQRLPGAPGGPHTPQEWLPWYLRPAT